MIVAVTGHRPDKLGGWKQPNQVSNVVRHSLSLALDDLVVQSQSGGKPGLHIISGMALGVDQWVVELCVQKGIAFTAAIPHDNQDAKWFDKKDIARYHSLLKHAHAAYVISPGGYHVSKLHKRNEWMVDSCDLLLAAWDGTPGGTGSCVAYAQKIGRKIQFVKLPIKDPIGWTEPSFEENPPAASWNPKTGLKLSVSPFVSSIKEKAEQKAVETLDALKKDEKSLVEQLQVLKKKFGPITSKPTALEKKLSEMQLDLQKKLFEKMIEPQTGVEPFGPPWDQDEKPKYSEKQLKEKLTKMVNDIMDAPNVVVPYAGKPEKKKEEKKEQVSYGRKLDLDD